MLITTKIVLLDKKKRLNYLLTCLGFIIGLIILTIVVNDFLSDLELFGFVIMLAIFGVAAFFTFKSQDETLDEYVFKRDSKMRFSFEDIGFNLTEEEENKKYQKQDLTNQEIILDDTEEEEEKELDALLREYEEGKNKTANFTFKDEEIREEEQEVFNSNEEVEEVLSELEDLGDLGGLEGLEDFEFMGISYDIPQEKISIDELQGIASKIEVDVVKKDLLKDKSTEEIIDLSPVQSSINIFMDDLSISMDVEGLMDI